ncbi:MAG: flippase [Polaromonas sp.]|nr:flippase [Polaromonas sp.]
MAVLMRTEPKMLSGAVLARNTLWNLFGQGAPLLVAVFTIPPLIHGLGLERFGVLTLVWMVIGYFSLFDLGIGRALTQLVAERLGAGEEQGIPALVWTAMLLMLGFGLAGATAVAALSPLLVQSALKIPDWLQDDVLSAFYVLAAAIPLVVSTAGFIGVLAARQRFDLVNKLRIPMGLYTFLAPLVILYFSTSLFYIALALAVGRMVFFAMHLIACLKVMPNLRRLEIDLSAVRPLFRFGAWMTVSNVVGPLMVYLDRFVIGTLISMAAVAYYVTPYEVVTKLWIVPSAIVAVLFPAFSSAYVAAPERAAAFFGRGTRYVILIMFPITLFIVLFARQGLSIWLGPVFAGESVAVLQWLAVGVFINSVSQVPFSLVQGVGRADITAKLHLLEVPFYFLLLWWLLTIWGIEGAAIAWTARILLDTAFLFPVAGRVLPAAKPMIRKLVMFTVLPLFVLAAAAIASQREYEWLFFLIVLPLYLAYSWHHVLQPDERFLLVNRFKAIRTTH